MLRERGVSQPIDYHTQDYEAEVKRLTGGRGVHIVLDAMGGSHWKKGYRCLAPTGRLVMFGLSSAATGKTRSLASVLKTLLGTPFFSFPPPRLINDNRALIGVNLGHMWEQTELLTTGSRRFSPGTRRERSIRPWAPDFHSPKPRPPTTTSKTARTSARWC